MRQYMVVLKQDDAAFKTMKIIKPGDRRQVFDANVAMTQAFQHKLTNWIKIKGLDDEVEGVAEPSAFPIITMTSTPNVAKLVGAFAEVDTVTPDFEGAVALVPPKRGKLV